MQSSIVHKLLNLLNVISEAQKPLLFSEVVKKTGMNKSTIHRLLAIGAEEQMIRFDPHRKAYSLGPRVFDLVRKANSGYDIQAVALDDMIRLFDQVDANVAVGIPSGLEVVYLRVIEARHAMGGMQRAGMREAVHCSASGKAVLAYLPDQVVQSRMRDYDFKRCTERTITSPEAFAQELDFVRKNGFGKNDREEYDQFLSISAPIFDYTGDPVAVLSISSVHPRHAIEDLIAWSPELKVAALHVTELIGGIKPDKSDLIAS